MFSVPYRYSHYDAKGTKVCIMNSVKTLFKNINYNWLLFFIYAVITFTVIFYHEYDCDEVLAWNIAHAESVSAFFEQVRREGMPHLWYIISQLFIKFGFSIFSVRLVAWGIVLSAVMFFMLKAPFNLFFKIIFIFNAGMVYYYPIEVRNYSLIPLFLFLLAYLYPKRYNIPIVYSLLIILLFQSHPYIGGFCFILSFLFIFETLYILICRKPFNNNIKDPLGGG